MNSPMHDFKSGNKLNAKLDAHFWRVFLNTCSPRLAQAHISLKIDLEGPRCSWLVDAGWDCLFILCIHSCPGMPWLKIGEWLLLLLEIGSMWNAAKDYLGFAVSIISSSLKHDQAAYDGFSFASARNIS